MEEDCGCQNSLTDRAIAIIGLVVGFGVVVMAADLLTGGRITRGIVPARKLAAVVDFPGADDASA